MNINHTYVTLKIMENLGKINNLYSKTLQKVSDPFDVPVKNVKSCTTTKVSVFAPHKPTSNLIILKETLGTLVL